jgi:hypothetical protein
LDHYRFGEFEYQDFDSVNDFRVERYLPEAATNITVDKRPGGFRAKFTISRASLDQWFEQVWKDKGKNSARPADALKVKRLIDRDEFNREFGDLGWAPPDAIEYKGPRKSNWAGFTIWHSPSENMGYERAGYW